MQPTDPENLRPGLTASGRKKKPDKWANILRAVTEEYDKLLRTVQELEEEQRSLRVKESLLLQVLDIMQAIVADVAANAACAQPSSTTAGGSCAADSRLPADPPAAGDPNTPWRMVVSAVQQREQEIQGVYGSLLGRLFPGHQQQMHGMELLKVLCSPYHVAQVSSMPEAHMTSRLAVLAGKIALQILQQQAQDPPEDPATAAVADALDENMTEFSALAMSTMIWNRDKFKSILHINLDTLQPLEEPLSQEHWLRTLKQLQLSDEQLHVLSTVHDMHFWSNCLKLRAELDRNMQQQVAATAAVANLLQQQQQLVQQAMPAAAAAAAAAAGAPAGLSSDHVGSRPAVPPSVQVPAFAAEAAPAPPGMIPLDQLGGSAARPASSTSAPHAAVPRNSSVLSSSSGAQQPPAGRLASASSHAGSPTAPVLGCGALAGFGAAGAQAGSSGGGAGMQARAVRDAMQCGRLKEAQEELAEERQRLLRRWVLLGLHVGIVTSCTLSTYQQAVFVAAAYPSIPRMDLAMAAWREHKKEQQAQAEQEKKAAQQTKLQRRHSAPTRQASTSALNISTPEDKER